MRRAYVVIDEDERLAQQRVTSLRFQQAVPTGVMVLFLCLSVILMAAAVALIVTTLLLPSVYEAHSPLTGLAQINDTNVTIVPSFDVEVGWFEVCYDGTSNCRSRNDDSLQPLSSESIVLLVSDQYPAEVAPIVDRVIEVAVDFSLNRGAKHCGNTKSSAQIYRGLVVAGLCLAGLCGLLGAIPGVLLINRMGQRKQNAAALQQTQSLRFVNDERRRAKSEALLLALTAVFYFAAVVGIVVAMVLFYRLEEDILRCDGSSLCDSFLDGMRPMYASSMISNYTTSAEQPTCGSGPALICFWVALLVVGLAFVALILFVIMYLFSRRRQRIYDECKQTALRLTLEQNEKDGALSDHEDTFQGVHEAPLTYSPRDRSPSPSHSLAQVLQERLQICIEEEHLRRQNLKSLEHCAMYGSVHYPHRKLWRCVRVVTLHEWCLDWFFGPILDAHLEETHYRQELMRRWFSGVCKILSETTRKVGHAFPTPNLHAMYATASHYRDAPSSSRIGAFADRQAEWMHIVDSPTRRSSLSHPRRAPSGDSVEISSDSSSDDGLEATATPLHHRPFYTPPPRNNTSDQFRMTYEELIRRATTRRPFHRFQPQHAPQRSFSPVTPRPVGLNNSTHGMSSFQQHNSSFGGGGGSSIRAPRYSSRTVAEEISAADETSRAYAASLYRSSQRPLYDHGYDARHDAATDFRSAMDRGRQSTPTSALMPRQQPWEQPTAFTPLDTSSFRSTPSNWSQPPTTIGGRWGEEIVRERLSQLNRFQEESTR